MGKTPPESHKKERLPRIIKLPLINKESQVLEPQGIVQAKCRASEMRICGNNGRLHGKTVPHEGQTSPHFGPSQLNKYQDVDSQFLGRPAPTPAHLASLWHPHRQGQMFHPGKPGSRRAGAPTAQTRKAASQGSPDPASASSAEPEPPEPRGEQTGPRGRVSGRTAVFPPRTLNLP